MTRTMRTFNFIFSLTLAALLAGAASAHAADVLPERLSQTGLYADIAAKQIAPGVLSFSPQYPLWSDGARKQRWIALPPGTSVDASDSDAWVFPVGTRLWKEFAFDRRIETRFLELTAAGWAFATYRWLDDESDAVLAAKLGERAVYRLPDGVAYDLPARSDCRACHEGNVSGVLGFSGSISTTWVSFETWMKASPRERGMRGFTRAIRLRAAEATALVFSTPTPKEQ